MSLMDVCLESVSEETGVGRVRTLGCGHERPTWPLWGDGPGHHSCVHRPTLVGSELQAAVSSLFACDISYKRG
jgi:hypothetical protein